MQHPITRNFSTVVLPHKCVWNFSLTFWQWLRAFSQNFGQAGGDYGTMALPHTYF